MTSIARILVIDDDDTSNFIAQRQLTRYNISDDITVLSNGQEGRDFLLRATKLPDLVFLDINMPVMNGFEFLEWFDSSELKGKVKFTISSTSVRQEDKELASRYDDVVMYLEKPLTEDKIQQLIGVLGGL